MNLSNAFGKFGALIVDIITFVKPSLADVSDGFAGWLGTENGKSALRLAVETAVKSLTEEYKKSLPPSEPKPVGDFIDFDSAAFCPPGLTVAPDSDQIASRVRGVRKLGDLKVQTYLDVGQKGYKWIEGYNLKQRLEGKNVLGAQILDFYLEHPDLIPKELKTKGVIFFWGTLYRGRDGTLYVRYLDSNGVSWFSNYRRLGLDWVSNDPAAVSASSQSQVL